MIPLEEARAEVLSACPPRQPGSIHPAESLRLVLADSVYATEPVPPFANTAMDGYAVRAEDVAAATEAAPARLRVVGTVAAGHAPTVPVGPGEALRIMTGAPFPTGADAVAIVETTSTDGADVLVAAPAEAGVHVRPAGEDIQAGQEVFLGPGHIGVLCSIGCEKVTVVPAPVVGVLSTGDELVEGAAALLPGQIRDSNRHTLMSLLRRDGFGVVDLGIARDDEAVIERSLLEGVERCDAVMTSGGVSMGDFDYVKAVLDRIGRMHWMQVAIRPAKPFAFGVIGATPVFGLPGNPVSSMVSYEVLARPGLRRMGGHADDDLVRPVVAGIADSTLRAGRDGRTTFVRVRSSFSPDGRVHASSTGGQGSHQLHAMALADALVVLPPGQDAAPGDDINLIFLRP
jgi:molybdopterin molybdotransferase